MTIGKQIKVIMDCRTTAAHNLRTRLGFNRCDMTLTKEQSVLEKIIEGKNIETHYSVLGYRIDLYFHESKLTIEINKNSEVKKQKAIEEELNS